MHSDQVALVRLLLTCGHEGCLGIRAAGVLRRLFNPDRAASHAAVASRHHCHQDGMRQIHRLSVASNTLTHLPLCAAVGDCSTGATKKACANCTCGRAEEEAMGITASLTADMLDNPQSACGSVRPCPCLLRCPSHCLLAGCMRLHVILQPLA